MLDDHNSQSRTQGETRPEGSGPESPSTETRPSGVLTLEIHVGHTGLPPSPGLAGLLVTELPPPQQGPTRRWGPRDTMKAACKPNRLSLQMH